jgi:hypothetical protein
MFTVAFPPRVDAASVPHKAIFTFGELNERSGVLFVGQAAEVSKNRVSMQPSSMFAKRQVCRLAKLSSRTLTVRDANRNMEEFS